MNNKTKQELIEEINSIAINSEPQFTHQLSDGRERQEYFEKIDFQNKTYTYWINWVGYNDGEDEGEWSEPYDIQEDI